MITPDSITSPERCYFEKRKSSKPSLEWFVFVINEMCPRALIWSPSYRGETMLREAALKHGYNRRQIDNFLVKNGYDMTSLKRKKSFANRDAEDYCFQILIQGTGKE